MMRYLLLALAVIVLILLIIFGRSSEPIYEPLTPTEQAELTVMHEKAYNFAKECGGATKQAIPFDKINWVIVPGSELKYNATDGVAHLRGYFSPNDSTIYIPYTERDKFWIAAHESLHALGWMGHPNKPFMYPCMLTSEQNP